MIRYVTRVASIECGDEWYEPLTSSLEVIEEEHRPVDTGLLDQRGQRLFRVQERGPVGFKRER